MYNCPFSLSQTSERLWIFTWNVGPSKHFDTLKYTSERCPCFVFWLFAFTYLFIHLFVPSYIPLFQYHFFNSFFNETMSFFAISATHNSGHNILEFLDITAQKMKFFIKDFSSKGDQISRKFLQIWSQLMEKFLMESFIFCAVSVFYPNFLLLQVKRRVSVSNNNSTLDLAHCYWLITSNIILQISEI